jgi:adenylate cyclase
MPARADDASRSSGGPPYATAPRGGAGSAVCATMCAMDFAAAGLLDGLQGEDRRAREQLLQRLSEEGVGLDELQAAVAEDRLALLPVERVLGGRYTAAEIEQRTGLPAELMLHIRGLLGLPEPGEGDREFGEEDIAAAESQRLFLEAGFGEEAIAEITRVLGESMARLAATATAAFVDTFLEPGDSEQEVALRFAALARQLAPALAPVLVAAFNAHLRESVRRGILGRAEREAGHIAGAQQITVCFADLVGFTRLGGEVEAWELGSVAVKLGELATRAARPPVRLVKTIGDAAMFVSPAPGPLVAVALELVHSAQAADLPTVRAGVADGLALARAGDYYGQAVNLASRVTGVARPGSVLCTQDVRDAAGDEFEWSFAGRHRLKGIAEAVALHRARLPALDAPDGATGPKAGRRRRRASS